MSDSNCRPEESVFDDENGTSSVDRTRIVIAHAQSAHPSADFGQSEHSQSISFIQHTSSMQRQCIASASLLDSAATGRQDVPIEGTVETESRPILTENTIPDIMKMVTSLNQILAASIRVAELIPLFIRELSRPEMDESQRQEWRSVIQLRMRILSLLDQQRLNLSSTLNQQASPLQESITQAVAMATSREPLVLCWNGDGDSIAATTHESATRTHPSVNDPSHLQSTPIPAAGEQRPAGGEIAGPSACAEDQSLRMNTAYSHSSSAQTRPGCLWKPFPVQLYDLLASEEYIETVHWDESGTSFTIENPRRFNEIAPHGLGITSLKSILKRFREYNIERLGDRKVLAGQESLVFRHVKLQRGRRELAWELKRAARTDGESGETV